MPAAARLTDPIGHSPTMSWLLKGLIAGAVIAAVGVAIVGTGGLAAVAIVGGTAAMGAGLGEAMSTMSFAPKEVSGAIAMVGSTNVFTNSMPAARAHVDMVMCSKHPGPPIPIATGSGTVFINGMPAARVDDKTGCSGSITKGSRNVFIGGGTVQTDAMSPENLVPGWVHGALLVVGVGSAIVLAGPVIAVGGLVGGIAGGFGGGWLGGKIFGEGSDGQKWSALAGSFLGGILGAKVAPGAWRVAGGGTGKPVAAPSEVAANVEESASPKTEAPALNSPEEFETFYHGGSPESISSIRASGIDLSRSKPYNDFGDGFYMTTSKPQAIESAKMVNSEQAVVEFRVPKAELEQLNSKKFDSPNAEWADFVSINKELDVPYLPPKEWSPPTYDLIEGPLFRRLGRDGEVRHWPDRANQTSIHTEKAVDLFNRYMVKED